MKKTIIILIVLAIVIYGGWSFYKSKQVAIVTVNSYESCVAAGYEVVHAERNQCKTPDGRVYAEETTPAITYKNSSKDLIQVDLPYPGAVTGKEFVVSGKARGTWFFEASFPVEVLDSNGNVLFQGPAQAQSEWMTENFVPYKVTVKVPQSYIGPATLILHKDNPSGEPSRDASISFPITIEY